MNKIFITFFFAITLLLLWSDSSSAKEVFGEMIYVDDNNIEGPWDGTIEHPYRRIQDAIDNASIGDTIFVYNGTYFENIVVDKRLVLIGEDKNTTIIDAGHNGDAVNITVNHVTVSDFMVRNAASRNSSNAGIKLLSSNNSNVLDCIIINNGIGILLNQSNHNYISRCQLSSNGYGIVITSNSSNASVFNSNISRNGKGIKVVKSQNTIVSHNNFWLNDLGTVVSPSVNSMLVMENLFTNNLLDMRVHSLVNSSSSFIEGCFPRVDIVIENNVFRSPETDNSYRNVYGGILLGPANSASIKGNTFSNSGIIIYPYPPNYTSEFGYTIVNNTVNGKPLCYYEDTDGMELLGDAGQLLLLNCSNTSIDKVTLTDTLLGVELLWSTNTVFTDSAIKNVVFGVFVVSSDDVTICNSSFENVYWLDISMVQTDDSVIKKNRLFNSFHKNIPLHTGSDSLVASTLIDPCGLNSVFPCNTFSYSTNGIFVSNVFNVTVQENNVLNHSNSIRVLGSEDITVSNCEISVEDTDSWRLLTGIDITSSSGIMVSNCSVENTDIGIELCCSNNNTIFNCDVLNNGRGIEFYEVSNSNLISCNIYLNTEDGIWFSSADNNMISECNIYSNNWCGVKMDVSDNNRIINCSINYNNLHGLWLDESKSNIVSNNTVYSNNADGVCLHYSDNNIISDCNVCSNNQSGVKIHSSNGNRIIKSEIYSNGLHGVNLLELSENNTVSHCIILSNTDGVNLQNSMNNMIHDCIISNNEEKGVHIHGSDNTSIFNCSIHLDKIMNCNSDATQFLFQNHSDFNNDLLPTPLGDIALKSSGFSRDGKIFETAATGVTIEVSSKCSIVNSTITSSCLGIQLYDSHNIVIENNAISSNGEKPTIYIFSCYGNKIRLNDIVTGSYGIYLDTSGDNNIEGNRLLGSFLFSSYGIYVLSTHNTTILGNNFTNCYSSIKLTKANNNAVNRNNMTSCYYALQLISSNYNTIQANNMNNNTLGWCRALVHLYNSSNNKIDGNSIVANEGGIFLRKSNYNTVRHNTLRNSMYGVYVLLSQGNNIFLNNIVDNSLLGIGLEETFDNMITKNNIQRNGDPSDSDTGGVRIHESRGDTLSWNNIEDNKNFGMKAFNSRVNVRFNWWGSFFGPSRTRFLLRGDRLVSKISIVRVFPWAFVPVT